MAKFTSFNIGKDCRVTINITNLAGQTVAGLAINGITSTDLGLLESIRINPNGKGIVVTPLNNEGIPVERAVYDRFSGAINVARVDGAIDALAVALYQAQKAGGGAVTGTVDVVINSPSGAQYGATELYFKDCVFRVTDMGTYNADEKVSQAIEFTAGDVEVKLGDMQSRNNDVASVAGAFATLAQQGSR
jgi:hypothetical protein